MRERKTAQPTLQCPDCGNFTSRVKDSRPAIDGAVRRVRECRKCQTRFSSLEAFERTLPIKKALYVGSTVH